MRLPPSFVVSPSPGGDIADDGVSAFIDRHMLHADRLFARAPVSLQGFGLCREGPRQLVERSLRTVLLRDVLNRVEPTVFRDPPGIARTRPFRAWSC